MAKKPEAYRGEDRTLELIRERYNIVAKTITGDTPNQTTKDAIWNEACIQLRNEFEEQELNSTVAAIHGHMLTKENGEIWPLLDPLRNSNH